MTWIHRLRLRALAWLVGIVLLGVAVVSWAAVPAWPVVGVAVAVVVAAMSSMTSRLGEPMCWSCGQDLAQVEPGEHGFVCPGCGSINQTLANAGPESEPPASEGLAYDSDDQVA